MVSAKAGPVCHVHGELRLGSRTALGRVLNSCQLGFEAVLPHEVEQGVEFVRHPRHAYGLPMMAPAREMRAGLDWQGSGPHQFLSGLAARHEAAGGRLLRGTEAVSLIVEGGACVGVEVRGPDGAAELRAGAVVLCDVEGFTYQEIADVLGCPVGTVRSRIARARKHLEKHLVEYAKENGYGEKAVNSSTNRPRNPA